MMVTAGSRTQAKFLALALLFAFLFVACSGGGATITPGATATPGGTAEPSPSQSATGEASPGLVNLPPPELKELRVGQSGVYSANVMHTEIIQALNLPAKYGFTKLEFNVFNGATQAAQALLAGQIDFGDFGASPVVGSLATDSPLIMAFVTRDNLTDNLYAQADIKTADDLRGKAVAVSSFGTQSHAGALVALKSLGLTPQDVVITQVGNDSARLAAIKGGSVAASINDGTQEQNLAVLGIHPLVRLTEVEGVGGVPRTGLTFTRDFVAKYPNTVLNLVAIWLEANTTWRADPALSATTLAKFAEISAEEAQAQITAVLKEPWTPLDGTCDPTSMEFTYQTLLPTNPDLAGIKPTDGCTNEFIDKLKTLGFMHQIGVPGY